MSPTFVRALPYALLILALGGCAETSQIAGSLRQPRCEDVAGNGTSFSASTARAIASSDVGHQIGDVKGLLLRAGYHHIRTVSHSTTCAAYPLNSAMTQCVARTRLCGR